MKNIRVLVVVAFAMLLSGCGIFGGDDASTDVTSTAEQFEPEPTANVVQAVPVDGTDTAAGDAADTAAAADEATAAAPLPTAVTIPTPEGGAEAASVDRSQPTSYVVQSGDVLGLIAERFDVDIAELRRVNDLSGNLIRVGQTLTIPAEDGSTDALADETAGADETDETDETASAPVGSTTPSTPSPTPTPVSCGANAVGHCVQSGDSLLGIASEYGTTVDALRTSNPSIVGDTIRIGDLLTIPGQTASSGGDTTGDTTGGTTGGTSTDPTPIPAPQSDADCAARNIEFPYFHAADGLCYANPIGGSGGDDTLDTGSGVGASTEGARFVTVAIPSGQVCPDSAPYYGQFEKDSAIVDGPACYPAIAVIEPTPTPGPTSTPSVITIDYGDGPDCDAWEVVIPATNKCWPGENATDAEIEAGRVKADS